MMVLFIHKLGRDLREHWAQFAAVCLMAALSVLIFSGLEGGWKGIEMELDSFAAENRMPDAWITGLDLTDEDLAEVEQIGGVDEAALVSSIPVTVTRGGTVDDLELSTRGVSDINSPRVVTGAPVDSSDGVWLDESYAKANNLDTGDRMTVTREGEETELLINGLILQPDKIAYAGSGMVAPDASTYGYGLVSNETARELAAQAPVSQSIVVSGDPAQLGDAVRTILGDRYGSFTETDTYPHVATAYERVDQIRSLSYLFSSLFLLVALLSISTSIRRLTDIQRAEVAILKALGYSNRVIASYYTAVGIVAVSAGCVAGLALTPALSRYVLDTQQGSFSLPIWQPAYAIDSAALPLVLITVCIVASWSATRRMRRMSPAEGMRPDTGRARRTPLERLRAIWQRIPYGSRWAIRDATGSPVRVIMGVIATTGCMMLLVTGFGMPDTLNKQVELSYEEQYRYDTRLQISPLAGAAARDRIESEAGTGQWIEQSPARIDSDGGVEHTLTVLGEGDLFRVLDSGGDPVTVDDGAIISERLANQLGVDVGDEINVETTDGSGIDLQITALTSISEPQGVLVSDSTWAAAGGIFTPNGYLTEKSVGQEVIDLSAVAGAVTLDEQSENARSLVASLTSVFTLIKVFAIILAVVVLYNLGAMSFTERIRDYATLRVLGFHHQELRSLASRENISTTLIGWLLGIPAGWWFLGEYVGLFSTDRASYHPFITMGSWAIASLITIVFAMTATLMLTRRIKGIDMTSALKGVE